MKNNFVALNKTNLRYADITIYLLIHHEMYGSIIIEIEMNIEWMINYKTKLLTKLL